MTRIKPVLGICLIAVCAGCAQVFNNINARQAHPPELEVMRNIIEDSLLESPQYHDFEHVIVGKPGQAGARMGARVIASPVEELNVNDASGKWWNVAVVMVNSDQGSISASGLKKGTNCFYVQNTSDRPLGKYIHKNGTTMCPQNPSTPGQARDVTPSPNQGDVPFAVRIHTSNDMDVSGPLRVLIGFKCGNRWCTIASFPANAWPQTGGSGNKDLIPGWHDEQFLTYVQNSTRIPSQVRARITPVENLDDIVFDGVFRNAAVIHVAGYDAAALPAIRRKWGLPNYNWESPVILQMSKDSAGKYWARYSAGTQTSVPILAEYKHIPLRVDMQRSRGMLVQVASTARWSIISDGGAWVRCDDGCCTVT